MTEPLRLMLWHWGRHGGGPRYTYELAAALKDVPGVETHLSLSRQCEIADGFRDLGLPILWVDTYTSVANCALRSAALPLLLWRMRHYIRKHRIDVVNSTMTHLWTRLVTPMLRGAGVRTLCTVHDATLHPGEWSHLKDWFYAPVPGVDGYITLTNFVAARLTEVHGIPAERISIAPHGVNASTGADAVLARPADTPLRLLFFGRILPYKGLDRLLDAYEILLARGYPVALTIAGSGDLGNMAERMIRLPGITLHHRWICEDDIPGYLAKADCVVLPYIEASQSGVVPAAFAAGVPAVVTPVGGLPEQVAHGRDGLITEGIAPAHLVSAITRLMDEPELLPALQAGARASSLNELSWGVVANRVAEISRMLCTGARAVR